MDVSRQPNMTLLQLQKAIEKVMVTDLDMYAKLQAGLKGINSLARQTSQLKVNRDVSGATCINQYVMVKTLGRGSYGKVKLCLNTMDGQLYAIKMMNRSYLLRTLQRPRATLRKSARRATSLQSLPGGSGGGAGSSGGGAASAAHPAAAGATGSSTVCGAASSMPMLRPSLSSREPDSSDEVSREIAILKKLDHPNVVKLYEVRGEAGGG
jgi:serine/threonine protein kinase